MLEEEKPGNSKCVRAQSCLTLSCLVAQSCLTLCDLRDCSHPDSSVHGVQYWSISCIGRQTLYHWLTWFFATCQKSMGFSPRQQNSGWRRGTWLLLKRVGWSERGWAQWESLSAGLHSLSGVGYRRLVVMTFLFHPHVLHVMHIYSEALV